MQSYQAECVEGCRICQIFNASSRCQDCAGDWACDRCWTQIEHALSAGDNAEAGQNVDDVHAEQMSSMFSTSDTIEYNNEDVFEVDSEDVLQVDSESPTSVPPSADAHYDLDEDTDWIEFEHAAELAGLRSPSPSNSASH